MNAGPLLDALVRALNEARLEAILIGNAAAAIHGVKSFNSLRSRAEKILLSGHELTGAHLADTIASKRSAGRPGDKAVIEILEKTLREKIKSAE